MKTKEEIQQMLDEEVNTLLKFHKGRVDVRDLIREDGKPSEIHVTMSGGCQGCAGAKYTLSTLIQNKIATFDPSIDLFEDVTDHASGTTPYYTNESDVTSEDEDV